MPESTPQTVVEAAAPETVPTPEDSRKPRSLTTSVWVAGKNVSIEALRTQAVINTRDAVPVIAYDKPDVKVTGTKAKKVDGVDGTVWELSVTYAPMAGAPKEPVDLEKVIKEAQATYGVHEGDPDFLGEQR